MRIVKSKGVTRTEKLLAELCERSFLRLWSYPNPFKEDRDELCDLLAVFENHVFIFFDRENLQLADLDKNPLVVWDRWKRKAIDAQLQCADGAARYIRSGRPIFLDSSATLQFPIAFNPSSVEIHKIIVAHGAKDACKAYSEENVYGSLAISYADGDNRLNMPFKLDLDRHDPVHVFDSHNLEIVFGELDTFHDLVAYFDAKIEAINRCSLLSYCGEEDLLAHYFLNYDEQYKRHFIGPRDGDYDLVSIGEGQWKDFIELEQYKNKQREDVLSYFWDHLIQKTCENALNGTVQGNADLLGGNSALHEMAKEPRIMRRAIASKMLQSIEEFPDGHGLARKLSLMPSYFSGTAYVFLQIRAPEITNYEKHRARRQALLEIACGAAKNKWPHLAKVVGIGMDAPKFARTNSEDFILMDCENWTPEMSAQYEEANRELKCFASARKREFRVNEFPLSPRADLKLKTGRNDPCPCGSGLKFKKCCLAKRP